MPMPLQITSCPATVHENQRWWVGLSWCRSKAVDRAPFTDQDGNAVGADGEAILDHANAAEEQPGAVWLWDRDDRWQVLNTSLNDAEGWTYASSWKKLPTERVGGRAAARPADIVRCRALQRRMLRAVPSESGGEDKAESAALMHELLFGTMTEGAFGGRTDSGGEVSAGGRAAAAQFELAEAERSEKGKAALTGVLHLVRERIGGVALLQLLSSPLAWHNLMRQHGEEISAFSSVHCTAVDVSVKRRRTVRRALRAMELANAAYGYPVLAGHMDRCAPPLLRAPCDHCLK